MICLSSFALENNLKESGLRGFCSKANNMVIGPADNFFFLILKFDLEEREDVQRLLNLKNRKKINIF